LYFLKRWGFAFLTQATDLAGPEIKSFRETQKDLVWTPATSHRVRIIACFLALERAVHPAFLHNSWRQPSLTTLLPRIFVT
jgi:hypothetical protein